MIGIGVIGCGYWGPNLIRNLAGHPEGRLVAVADRRPEALAGIARRYPAAAMLGDALELIAHPQVDAVVIATPVASHAELGLLALRQGKHVLIEKPLAATRAQALELVEEAGRRKLTLMVDHTFVYTGAVRKIRELVRSPDFGESYYYDSVRVNLGLFQSDVNVVWDLAIHDLSILDHVIGEMPVAVSAIGLSHVPGKPENIAYLTLLFARNFVAHIHVNWLAPVKVRRTLIGGSRRMIVWDDLEPSEKVKVYDRGITLDSDPERVYQMRVGYRVGDMWAPQLELTEALAGVADEFLRAVREGGAPRTGGEAGLRMVSLLEAASLSLRERGRPVEVARHG